MDKSFNELFDEFFKKNNIKPEDKVDESIKKEIDKIIDVLTRVNESPNLTEEQERIFDKTLGVPDKVEIYNDGHLSFEKRVWHTKKGDLIKIIIIDDPLIPDNSIIDKPLDKQLEDAVEKEDYEKACILRDLIKKKEKK